MSHQALARRWRPRDFKSLIGQEPVVKALTHALSTQRLHHAYLLTGTRGVGKTTIARILAKSLNCERGVSAEPCGQCSACLGIDAGRFVDYIEMDAASNRGVEEMTAVLEQAVYSPSAGRYKVYVIDEVHMLSNHAFNAMLKTLEEPPGHVIFVLATTDPQKVPVTVLSRCLQFNLKNMTPRAITGHLHKILAEEAIEAEPAALEHIAVAARGSMRDALSLLDQAIAFGGGRVPEAEVRDMLGVIDSRFAEAVLEALVAMDAKALLDVAEQVVQANLSVEMLLQDVAALLQRVAVLQAGVVREAEGYRTAAAFVDRVAPEDVQIYYQVALYAARDAQLAVDPHSGLTMALLRMLAFSPDSGSGREVAPAGNRSEPAVPFPRTRVATPASKPSVRPSVTPAMTSAVAASAAPALTPPVTTGPVGRSTPANESRAFDGDWPALSRSLGLGGLALQFLQQSELISAEGLSFRVRVPIKALADTATVGKVRDALSQFFGSPVKLVAEVGAVTGVTAAALERQSLDARTARAHESIEADPFVKTLISDFGGRVLPESVRPNE